MTLQPRIALWMGAILMFLTCSLAVAEDDVQKPELVTHQHYNYFQGPVTMQGDGAVSFANYRNPSIPICSLSSTTAANVNTDCEGNAPHNETSIAINPDNNLNLIGSANDYELFLTPGGSVVETSFSRAHVTFDGGQSWTTYPIRYNGYMSTGDPAISFDADGTAYLATLGFVWSQNIGCCTNPDVLVATSQDGGKTWTAPQRVASGSGSFNSVGTFNDKEYLAAWGHGNAIVTWTVFKDGLRGSYINSAIYSSVTHDGGKTWTAPTEISGSAAFCVGATGGTACDQDQGSTPAVAADGSIYVSFVNYAGNAEGRDQYLVVKVDPITGQRVAGPYQVGLVYDGFHDYAINIDGRQTYQDSQFRTWAVGNIAADPTNAQHLAVIWSDMRNGPPTSPDPYATTTNSDVIVSQSLDGGATWSAPRAVAVHGDQFMPWGAYDSSGKLRIGYFDRSYDPANHRYGYTLATETAVSTLSFATAQITTTLSDPTKNDRWFSGRTPNPAFPNPTTFLGDYSNIATAPGLGVAAYWTDMRNLTTFGVRTGYTEDAYFGVQ